MSFQVDVSYFTSPVTASERAAAPKPRAPSKTSAKPPTPLPELATPRQLAAAGRRPSSSQPMTGIESILPIPSTPARVPPLPIQVSSTAQPSTSTTVAPIGDRPPGLGQKRPAEDTGASGPEPKRRPPPGAERPAPKPKLPAVREKKKPSIFMPSRVRKYCSTNPDSA